MTAHLQHPPHSDVMFSGSADVVAQLFDNMLPPIVACRLQAHAEAMRITCITAQAHFK